MKPATTKQREVLDVITRLVAEKNRAVVLWEISTAMDKPFSTVNGIVQHLIKQGLLQRGRNGRGRGLQPTPGNTKYQNGWVDGITALATDISTILIQHHASKPLIVAVGEAVQDIKNAMQETPDATPQEGTNPEADPEQAEADAAGNIPA